MEWLGEKTLLKFAKIHVSLTLIVIISYSITPSKSFFCVFQSCALLTSVLFPCQLQHVIKVPRPGKDKMHNFSIWNYTPHAPNNTHTSTKERVAVNTENVNADLKPLKISGLFSLFHQNHNQTLIKAFSSLKLTTCETQDRNLSPWCPSPVLFH